MSESDKARRCVDRAVQELHEINIRLQNHNDSLRSYAKTKENEIEFHKQQARVSHFVVIFICIVSFVAIGLNMSICQ